VVVFPQHPQHPQHPQRRLGPQPRHLLELDRRDVPHLRPTLAGVGGVTEPLPQLEHSAGGSGRSTRSGNSVRESPDPECPGCPPGVRSFERNRCERTLFRLAYAAIESFDSAVALLKPLVVKLLSGDRLPLASHRSIVFEYQTGEWPMRSSGRVAGLGTGACDPRAASQYQSGIWGEGDGVIRSRSAHGIACSGVQGVPPEPERRRGVS